MAGWVLIALVSSEARADCPDGEALVVAAERAALEARFAQGRAALDRFEAALGCGPLVQRGLLGRYWITEGVVLAATGEPDAALDSFAAAWRVAPGHWNEAFGERFRKIYDSVAPADLESGTIALEPDPGGLVAALDGRPTSFPILTAPGLHVVQVGTSMDAMAFGRFVVVLPGETVAISTGLDPALVTSAAGGEREGGRSPPLAQDADDATSLPSVGAAADVPPTGEGQGPPHTWLLMQVGYMAALYRYEQRPVGGGAGFLEDAVGLGDAPRLSYMGAELHARGWLPPADWLGFEAALRFAQVGGTLTQGDLAVADWVNDFRMVAVSARRGVSGSVRSHLAARVGFGLGNALLFVPTPEDPDTYASREIAVLPNFVAGGEAGAELGERWVALGSIDLGLAAQSRIENVQGEAVVAYEVAPRLVAHLGVGLSFREIAFYEPLTGDENGVVEDDLRTVFAGFGYRLSEGR